MSRPSTIELLPPEEKAELDKLLASGRMTLDSLLDHLTVQGLSVSRSALGRYRKSFDEVAVKLRESREVAAAFAKELGAVPDDDMGQLLTELVHTLTFKVASADAKFKPMDVMLLAKALKDLSSSKQTSTKLAMQIRAEEKKRLKEEVIDKLKNAEGQGGLSKETAAEARRILGFET